MLYSNLISDEMFSQIKVAMNMEFTEPMYNFSLSILVIEDNEVNRRLAMRLLEKFGHKGVCAYHNESALSSIMTGNFDLGNLICYWCIAHDVLVMVEERFNSTVSTMYCFIMSFFLSIFRDGSKMVQEIRKLRPNIPIIGTSAYLPEMEGVDGFVRKPIYVSKLKEVLQQVWSKHITSTV